MKVLGKILGVCFFAAMVVFLYVAAMSLMGDFFISTRDVIEKIMMVVVATMFIVVADTAVSALRDFVRNA